MSTKKTKTPAKKNGHPTPSRASTSSLSGSGSRSSRVKTVPKKKPVTKAVAKKKVKPPEPVLTVEADGSQVVDGFDGARYSDEESE